MPNHTAVHPSDPNQLIVEVANVQVAAISGDNTGNGASGLIAGHEPFGKNPVGVFGRSENTGVFGFSDKAGDGVGVAGNTNAGTGTGVHGHTSTGVGVLGTSDGSGPAGRFVGNVEVSGNINVSSSGDIILGDFAEHFDLADIEIEQGTVVTIGQDGNLRPSNQFYDKKVAGVVSGAGNFRPAITLGKQPQSDQRLAISLVGKVYCKVDAQYSPIEIGDLLTTSETPGYAMKAVDQLKAFGAVIGKALRPLAAGQGLIPILIALQ
jgi:hypothetical protein